ncbi:MAG: helix-turn-helix domain-containing protein [Pararhodobacter sp.]
MDEKWFKQRQKAVGVTAEEIAARMGRARSNVSHILTGKQRMSLEWAQAFADVLDVPLATVLEKAGVTSPETASQVQPGFAEGDAAPWKGPKTGDPSQAIAQALGSARPGVDLWRVQGNAMTLGGLLPGDYMLIDTHAAERASAGDVVVAQIYHRNSASTVLRRFEPPVLVAASAEPADQRVHVVDGVNVVIRGKMIASWRAP